MATEGFLRKKRLPKITWWKTYVFVLACLVLALSTLWGAESVSSAHPVIHGMLAAIGEAFLISGTISVIADQLVRRDISNFWLDAVGIEKSIREAGLKEIKSSFHNFDFSPLFRSAKEIDVCFIYASAWLSYNVNSIKDFLSRDGGRLRVCLLDDGAAVVPPLADSFGYEAKDLQDRILKSVAELQSCVDDLRKCAKLKGQLLIYKHTRPPRYSYYRFDETLLLVSYNNARGRPDVPVFVFRDSSMGVTKFLTDDFEKVVTEHSTLVFDSSAPSVAQGKEN